MPQNPTRIPSTKGRRGGRHCETDYGKEDESPRSRSEKGRQIGLDIVSEKEWRQGLDSERLGKSMDSRNDREREMRDGGFLEVEAGGGGYYGKRILKKKLRHWFFNCKTKVGGKNKN